MDDDPELLSADRLPELLTEHADEDVIEYVEEVETASADDRKSAVRAFRQAADEQPRSLGSVLDTLTSFLTDDERAIRLTTAKLFVAVAGADPDAVPPCIDDLATRLADEDEFYYVRARSAEALGYVALEHPEEVASPQILADLRIGLSFDEPEVKEKLAKAIEYVALGNPDRLRHHVSNLADHLDDENELVRYHLCAALVVVGCAYPERLAAASEALSARLADENQYVRGRAVEALGVLARSDPDDTPVSADDLTEVDVGEDESFVADRVCFARDALAGSEGDEPAPEGIGTLDAIRGTTDEIVEEITSPDGDRECPHCGLALPENGPPMCPRCGAPY